jgi:hypothetical protein
MAFERLPSTFPSARVDPTSRKRKRSEAVAFGKLLAVLAMMKGRDPMGVFQIEVFEDALVDVPLHIIAEAVRNCQKPGAWRPDLGDFLGACEKVRLDLRQRMKHEPCVYCEHSPGWTEVKDDAGVMRARRCDCWTRHQEKVNQLVSPSPVALLTEGEE